MNEVEMLEVLKEDYLGMQYKVKYQKTFTWKQINIDMGKVGDTIEEEMNFVIAKFLIVVQQHTSLYMCVFVHSNCFARE